MRRLTSQSNDHSSASRVHFIIDQVTKPLIVNRTYKDQILKGLACVRIEHPLIAVALESCTMELTSLLQHVEVRERGGVFTEIATNGCDFGSEALKQVTNSHSRRNAVRINNEIRHDSFNSEW